MPLRSALRFLLPVLLAALVWAPQAARAELWMWVDGDGGARYTPDPSTVPSSRRSSLLRVEANMPLDSIAGLAQPPALYAPSDEYSAADDPFANSGSTAIPGGDRFAQSAQPVESPQARARREELRDLIAADEERIKELISEKTGDSPRTPSPELRELAQRLPALQAELSALEAAAQPAP